MGKHSKHKNSSQQRDNNTAHLSPVVEKPIAPEASSYQSENKYNNEINNFGSNHNVADSSKKSKLYIYIAVLIVLCGLGYYYRSSFVVARVNGAFISKSRLTMELERQGGAQTLDSIITKELIKQELNKVKDIEVTQADVQEQISEIQTNLSKQGMDLNAELAKNGSSYDEFVSEMMIQKKLELFLMRGVEITDTEVADFVKQNNAYFAADASEDDKKKQATESLKQQKLGEVFQTWITEVKSKSNIKIYNPLLEPKNQELPPI